MTLRIIGAGFGRTSTLSLKKALERLGFDKCYHMSEVTPEHVPLWHGAAKGENVWSELFDGYQAAVDWPASAYWPELMAIYPEAKVLLTVRDPESWYKSISNTIFQRMKNTERASDPVQAERFRMSYELIAERTFGGKLDDRQACIDVFNANIERCKKEVPADRLIVFDGTMGWSGLCDPLRVPIPDEPYPSVNTTNEFRARWNMAPVDV